ncbi:MAG: VPLPA-CTERM sorting domain-containing protein [Syntrophobacterales bacterium]|jgi:hypothetical protein|nr:VPLPA-CTERM sorting domain-containing protein [Syntrophobacterales bacterium]
MRNKRLLQFLVVLCALWWALPALAGTVTLTQSHAVQISVTPPAGASANPDTGTLTAFADGSAEYPYEHPGPEFGQYTSVAFTPLVSPTPADATLPSGTYMTATQATTTYNGYSTGYDFALSQTQTGSAPGMASGNPGTLYQTTANSFDMSFNVDLAGTYVLGVADVYTLLCQLQNNGAGFPFFTGFTGYTDLYVDVWTDSYSFNDTGYASLLLEEQLGDGASRLTDFTSLQSGINLPQNFSFAVTAGASDTINVSVRLESDYTGSTVPLPPAVWLFGSGLTGLWLMRRRGLRP